MTQRRRQSLLTTTLIACALFALCALWPEATLAQCPLCKLSAASSGASATRALNLGIIVLLIPPVTIFCSFFVIAYKRRNPQAQADDYDEGGDVSLKP